MIHLAKGSMIPYINDQPVFLVIDPIGLAQAAKYYEYQLPLRNVSWEYLS